MASLYVKIIAASAIFFCGTFAQGMQDPTIQDYLSGRQKLTTKGFKLLIKNSFTRDGELVRQLVSLEENKILTDKHGSSLLHIAVKHGADDVVKLLLDSDYDVHAANSRNEIPLMVAVKIKSVEMVKTLLGKSHTSEAIKFAAETALDIYKDDLQGRSAADSIDRRVRKEIIKLLGGDPSMLVCREDQQLAYNQEDILQDIQCVRYNEAQKLIDARYTWCSTCAFIVMYGLFGFLCLAEFSHSV